MGGLAYALCFDTLDGILYSLQSFLMPVLVGFLPGYTGLLIFAVYPGYFYSNIVVLGFTPFTSWIQIGE